MESWVGWLHRVHLGVSSIFMWCNLLLVMQVFLSTLYCRSLASMARDVLFSFIICFSRISGASSWSDWNWLNLAQCFDSNEWLLRALKNSLHPFKLGFVIWSSGG